MMRNINGENQNMSGQQDQTGEESNVLSRVVEVRHQQTADCLLDPEDLQGDMFAVNRIQEKVQKLTKDLEDLKFASTAKSSLVYWHQTDSDFFEPEKNLIQGFRAEGTAVNRTYSGTSLRFDTGSPVTRKNKFCPHSSPSSVGNNEKMKCFQKQLENNFLIWAKRITDKRQMENRMNNLGGKVIGGISKENLNCNHGNDHPDADDEDDDDFKSKSDVIIGNGFLGLDRDRLRFLERHCEKLEKQLEMEKQKQLQSQQQQQNLNLKENSCGCSSSLKKSPPLETVTKTTFLTMKPNEKELTTRIAYLEQMVLSLEKEKIERDNYILGENKKLKEDLELLQEKLFEIPGLNDAPPQNSDMTCCSKASSNISAAMEQLKIDLDVATMANEDLKKELQTVEGKLRDATQNVQSLTQKGLMQDKLVAEKNEKLKCLEKCVESLQQELLQKDELLKKHEETLMEKIKDLNALTANFNSLEEKFMKDAANRAQSLPQCCLKVGKDFDHVKSHKFLLKSQMTFAPEHPGEKLLKSALVQRKHKNRHSSEKPSSDSKAVKTTDNLLKLKKPKHVRKGPKEKTPDCPCGKLHCSCRQQGDHVHPCLCKVVDAFKSHLKKPETQGKKMPMTSSSVPQVDPRNSTSIFQEMFDLLGELQKRKAKTSKPVNVQEIVDRVENHPVSQTVLRDSQKSGGPTSQTKVLGVEGNQGMESENMYLTRNYGMDGTSWLSTKYGEVSTKEPLETKEQKVKSSMANESFHDLFAANKKGPKTLLDMATSAYSKVVSHSVDQVPNSFALTPKKRFANLVHSNLPKLKAMHEISQRFYVQQEQETANGMIFRFSKSKPKRRSTKGRKNGECCTCSRNSKNKQRTSVAWYTIQASDKDPSFWHEWQVHPLLFNNQEAQDCESNELSQDSINMDLVFPKGFSKSSSKEMEEFKDKACCSKKLKNKEVVDERNPHLDEGFERDFLSSNQYFQKISSNITPKEENSYFQQLSGVAEEDENLQHLNKHFREPNKLFPLNDDKCRAYKPVIQEMKQKFHKKFQNQKKENLEKNLEVEEEEVSSDGNQRIPKDSNEDSNENLKSNFDVCLCEGFTCLQNSRKQKTLKDLEEYKKKFQKTQLLHYHLYPPEQEEGKEHENSSLKQRRETKIPQENENDVREGEEIFEKSIRYEDLSSSLSSETKRSSRSSSEDCKDISPLLGREEFPEVYWSESPDLALRKQRFKQNDILDSSGPNSSEVSWPQLRDLGPEPTNQFAKKQQNKDLEVLRKKRKLGGDETLNQTKSFKEDDTSETESNDEESWPLSQELPCQALKKKKPQNLNASREDLSTPPLEEVSPKPREDRALDFKSENEENTSARLTCEKETQVSSPSNSNSKENFYVQSLQQREEEVSFEENNLNDKKTFKDSPETSRNFKDLPEIYDKENEDLEIPGSERTSQDLNDFSQLLQACGLKDKDISQEALKEVVSSNRFAHLLHQYAEIKQQPANEEEKKAQSLCLYAQVLKEFSLENCSYNSDKTLSEQSQKVEAELRNNQNKMENIYTNSESKQSFIEELLQIMEEDVELKGSAIRIEPKALEKQAEPEKKPNLEEKPIQQSAYGNLFLLLKDFYERPTDCAGNEEDSCHCLYKVPNYLEASSSDAGPVDLEANENDFQHKLGLIAFHLLTNITEDSLQTLKPEHSSETCFLNKTVDTDVSRNEVREVIKGYENIEVSELLKLHQNVQEYLKTEDIQVVHDNEEMGKGKEKLSNNLEKSFLSLSPEQKNKKNVYFQVNQQQPLQTFDQYQLKERIPSETTISLATSSNYSDCYPKKSNSLMLLKAFKPLLKKKARKNAGRKASKTTSDLEKLMRKVGHPGVEKKASLISIKSSKSARIQNPTPMNYCLRQSSYSETSLAADMNSLSLKYMNVLSEALVTSFNSLMSLNHHNNNPHTPDSFDCHEDEIASIEPIEAIPAASSIIQNSSQNNFFKLKNDSAPGRTLHCPRKRKFRTVSRGKRWSA